MLEPTRRRRASPRTERGLRKTQNDLPERIRGTLVPLLNQHLADALDLGLQAKQAHWNVKGANFLALHQLFDEAAGEIEQWSDTLAERAVALGGIAEGTLQAIARRSRLSAYPVTLSAGSEHVLAFSSALAEFAASVRSAITAAADAEDADSADVYTEVSRAADKLLWKVEAHAWEA